MTSVIIVSYAAIVRLYARDAVKLAKRASTSFAPIVESIVRCVAIIFVIVAESATTARAVKEITVITANCAVVVRSSV